MAENKAMMDPNNFDSLDEYVKYRMNATRAMLNITCDTNDMDLIIPNLNFERKSSDINVKMSNMSVSEEDVDPRSNYDIISFKSKIAPPVGLFKEFTPLIDIVHKKVADAKQDSNNTPTENKNLAFISDKTHSESKRILQELQALYDHIKVLRNDPHQMKTPPDSQLNLYTSYNALKRKSHGECSTLGKVLHTKLRNMRRLPKLDYAYYNPTGKVQLFNFNTPYPH